MYGLLMSFSPPSCNQRHDAGAELLPARKIAARGAAGLTFHATMEVEISSAQKPEKPGRPNGRPGRLARKLPRLRVLNQLPSHGLILVRRHPIALGDGCRRRGRSNDLPDPAFGTNLTCLRSSTDWLSCHNKKLLQNRVVKWPSLDSLSPSTLTTANWTG
jgi:hypothetical protein